MQANAEQAPSAALAAGTFLGKYQVVRLIGEGGMGAVYEGLHLAIGKKVAIKIMSPELAADPDARARFLREAQLTSRVRHPHAVDVTDIGSEAGQPFLVMEFLEGEDLASFIEWRGRLPLQQAADIMLPVAAAVAAAHDEGIIHRDLKPHNIFLSQTRDGAIVPKVVDFGISKGPTDLQPAADLTPVLTPQVKTTVGLMGSLGYLAPEQLEGARMVSTASDQYGLGIILYECVTGRPPFPGDDVTKIFGDIVKGKRPPAGELRFDLPEDFERIIDRATSRDPMARFPSVRAMGNALLAFASPKAALTWANTFSEGEVSDVIPALLVPPRSFARWIVAALAVLGAAGAIAWWTLRTPPAPRTIETPAAVTTKLTTTRRVVIPAETPREPSPPDPSPPAAAEDQPAPRAHPATRAKPLDSRLPSRRQWVRSLRASGASRSGAAAR
jgi:serine/threonine protein kinase